MAARRVVAAVAASQAEQAVEELTLQLAGVQRNYESMSRMMQLKQQEVEQMRLKFEAEKSEATSLCSKLQDALARASAAEAAASGMSSQLDALQAERDRLVAEAGLANGRVAVAQGSVSSLRQATEDAEHRAKQLQHEADAARAEELQATAAAAAAQRLLQEAERDGRALASELHSLKDALTRAQAQSQSAEQHASTSNSRARTLEQQLAAANETNRVQKQRMAEDAAAMKAQEVALATARGQQRILEAQLRTAGRSAELTQQAHDVLAGRVTELQQDVAQARDACRAGEARIEQLSLLLSDAEDRCQQALVAGTSTSEVVTGLTVQLAQAKAATAEARRAAQEQAAAHSSQAASLTAAARGSAQQAQDVGNRLRQAHHRHADFAAIMLSRVESLMERLVAVQGKVDRDMEEGQKRHENVLAALSYQLQRWQEVSSSCADVLSGSMGGGLTALHSLSVSRHAQVAREVTSAKGDVATLQREVAELKAALVLEQGARRNMAEAKARQEADYASALASVRAASEERLEDERRRLTAKLASVEARVEELQAAHERDRQAVAKTLDMERAQLNREGVTLRDQIARLQSQLADAKELLQRAKSGQTADAASTAAQARRLADAQAALDVVQGHIQTSWGVTTKLLEDMRVVAQHLKKMGLQVQGTSPEDAAPSVSGTAGGTADAATLAKASGVLRLHFSYITEAVQALVVRGPLVNTQPLPQVSATDWTALAHELRSTVAKVLHVEESLATNCTCMTCLEIFRSPVTCVPCGHTYCKACLEKSDMRCVECDEAPVSTVLNAPLDAICCKADYKLSALKSISRAVQKGVA